MPRPAAIQPLALAPQTKEPHPGSGAVNGRSLARGAPLDLELHVPMQLAQRHGCRLPLTPWRFCLRRLETQPPRWAVADLAVHSDMAALRIWSGRQALSGLVACLIVVQIFVAGLHAAQFVEHQLVAGDPSICHGGNTSPNLPRSNLADPCCLLGCSVSGQVALLPKPTEILPRPTIAVVVQHEPVGSNLLLRSHLNDRAHSRPRSPPSA